MGEGKQKLGATSRAGSFKNHEGVVMESRRIRPNRWFCQLKPCLVTFQIGNSPTLFHALFEAPGATRKPVRPHKHKTVFVIIYLMISLFLSRSLVVLSLSFVLLLLILLSLYLLFVFCCLEVEQSCDASLLVSVSVIYPTTYFCIFLSVSVLLFLGRAASKYEHLHCRAL